MDRIARAFEALLETFGPQNWWPSETTFETAVGAVLTQGTAWVNAGRAVDALRAAGALTPEGLAALGASELEALVRPAGFQRRKAATIRHLAREAGETSDGWLELLELPTSELRGRLLAIPGIGPETADAILLYAAVRPVFVVDEYTRRFATRHGLARERAGYEELQSLFAASLGRDEEAFAECHALLVQLGKTHCRTRPRCDTCPLKWDLPGAYRAADRPPEEG